MSNRDDKVMMVMTIMMMMLVRHTKFDSTKNSMPTRDAKVDMKISVVVVLVMLKIIIIFIIFIHLIIVMLQVVGEFFYEQDCSTRPITVTEMKMQPECVDQTKVGC